MCGINGVINSDNKPVDKELVLAMRETLFHRGPDDAGIWMDGHVALAHRRLSIIDLSPAGRQPMCNEDRSLWLVFNGEIYNYLELREELKKKGHLFSSDTDAEVVLHAYEESGEDCVRHFNGMWAFALWDAKENKLFASRDRFGEKPFYYYESAGSFYFASEIKAFFLLPSFRKEINPQTAFLYLVYNVTDAGEDTFFQGIRQLLAGHSLILKEGRSRIYKYWDLDSARYVRYASDNEYIEVFGNILKESVRIRLRSDVEIGTSLSGGIDSSSILYMVNEINRQERAAFSQKIYSAIFPGHKDDESAWIKTVSQNLKINPFFISPSGDELLDDLARLISYQGEPFFSPNVFLQWQIMKLAKANGTVVLLDGQGADEQLAGYLQYFPVFWGGLIKQFKFYTLLKEFGQYLSEHGFDLSIFSNKAIFHNRLLDIILRRRYSYLRQGIFNDFINSLSGDKPASRYKSPLKNTLYQSSFKSSLPYLLRYADRNSMAFSREIRLPFLDYRLAEFIFALPDKFIIRGGKTKYILRRAIENKIPHNILNRGDKLGYVFPHTRWLNASMEKLIGKIICETKSTHQFFIPEKIRDYWKGYLKSGRDYRHTRDIWKIFNFLAWQRLIIEGKDIL